MQKNALVKRGFKNRSKHFDPIPFLVKNLLFMKPSIYTDGPLPDLSGTYTITITESFLKAVPAKISIEQNEADIKVSLDLKKQNETDSSPKTMNGKITERNRHHVIVEFENGTWERYVFTEGRFSGHAFLLENS
ncbi:hypothetical protein LEP1GSC052_1516 [Leptospira kmetyi serovar Malaysia str. Bejo-Iso9]|nr:hypothetical protein LEP1GSC052_1516 [Leptospira kmetyi serovar Malaysia str. Bejo-Iso9]